MSITKAQARFLAEGILNQLGSDKPSNDEDLPILEAMLRTYGAEFINQAKANIEEDKLVGKGNLSDIALEFTKYGKSYTLSLGYTKDNPASKYYDFVNKGVKGTKNEKADSKTKYKFDKNKKSLPVSVLRDWIAYSGIKSISVKKYTKIGVEDKIITDSKQIASAIARTIHRKGIRSSHFFDKAKESVFNKEFNDAMAEVVGKDIQLKIRVLNKELKNDNKRK